MSKNNDAGCGITRLLTYPLPMSKMKCVMFLKKQVTMTVHEMPRSFAALLFNF